MSSLRRLAIGRLHSAFRDKLSAADIYMPYALQWFVFALL